MNYNGLCKSWSINGPFILRCSRIILPAALLVLIPFCTTHQETPTGHYTPGIITLELPDRMVSNTTEKVKEDAPLQETLDAAIVIPADSLLSLHEEKIPHKTGTEAIAGAEAHLTTIEDSVKKIKVDLFIPQHDTIGDILVLPGWRFSRKRWQKETELLKLAEQHGYRCIFPEMGVSLYESEYFNETSIKWSTTPGGQWITKILIPTLREKYGIFKEGGNNYLLGLSTGGRGVVLLALQNPGLFTAGAALSGDYNQLTMPHDRLISSVYGPHRKFMKRWQTVDNPEQSILTGKWEMPLYIGHGKQDRIVPFSQSQSLVDTLKKWHPKVPIVFSEPEKGGHYFKFWAGEVPAIIKFFNEHKNSAVAK